MIKEGDIIPDATFFVLTPDGPAPRKTDDIFPGKKVVIIGVPGAFTPTCSMNHLPGFIENAAAMKGKGVDEVMVTGVNDVFVMKAWAEHTGGKDKVTFLSDGSAQFAKAIGADLDLTEMGFGVRSKRYSMIVDDGVVKKLVVEPNPTEADHTKAEHIMAAL